MSDKPPPRPMRSPLVTDEAPALPRRAPPPPPIPSRSAPRPTAPPSFSAPVTAPTGHAPLRAPAAKPVALSDDEQATKLFNAATAEQAELTVIAGQYKGKTVSLGAGTVVIGRSSDCELSLKGAEGASRRHCKVQYLGNRFVVIDLESRNGTVVNGQSVERKVLEQGDKIEIGDEIIQFIVHRLADLGVVDDGLSPFEETGSKTVPQQAQRAPSLLDAVSRDLADIDTGPPAFVPPAPVSVPVVPVAQPMFTSPVVVTTPPPPSRLPYVFGALAIVILGGGAALIYDLVGKDPVVDEATVAALADAKAEEAELKRAAVVVDAGTAPVVAAVIDAGTAAAVAAAVVDAGMAPVAAVAAVVDAGTPATPAATTPPAGATVIVRSGITGRASVIKVKVGDTVAVGDVLVVVGGDNGTMARKLDTLRREEREFAAAATDASARAELEEIRAEIKKIAARLETKPVTSTAAGTVVEVLVKDGDVVRDAAPVVVLQP